MSPRASGSTTTDDDEDEMDIEQEPRPLSSITGTSTLDRHHGSLAILLRDESNWLSHIRDLRETDVIILLTPVVIPTSQDPDNGSDPFEPLGRSLAQRHRRVRQVPYTHRNGITSTHVGFIKRGHVVILCFAIQLSQQIQLEVADVAFAVNDNKPCIIVVCCSPINPDQDVPFPTVIQTAGYSPPALEATVELIFGERSQSHPRTLLEPLDLDPQTPRLWPVEQWDEARDVSSVCDLWTECVSAQFAIDQQTLTALLRRPGYAKHYVVREPDGGHLLGFCATYLSYVDQEGEKLIASLAILLVRSSSRQKGVGLSLHSHAISQLKRTRGVIRLQLGSTYPRILHGPPFNMHINEEWFRRRGWVLNKAPTYDFVLDFSDWRAPANLSLLSNTTFRRCTQEDMDKVLVLVEKAAARQAKTGWFDQYLSLMNGPNVKDVLLGIENGTIIAAALTYTPSCGSQIASNLPWAGRIGSDVGGVTCVCIYPDPQESTAVGLLHACVQNLQSQGMKKMFMDGVTDGVDHLARLGFKEWARYRNVWKDV